MSHFVHRLYRLVWDGADKLWKAYDADWAPVDKAKNLTTIVLRLALVHDGERRFALEVHADSLAAMADGPAPCDGSPREAGGRGNKGRYPGRARRPTPTPRPALCPAPPAAHTPPTE